MSEMTCHKADKLMQDILNGELTDGAKEDLERHMGECEGCAEAWHAAWQVRAMLKGDDTHDPGEAYFERATASIMDRVSAIAAVQTAAPAVGEAPVTGSARFGPLHIRGVGVAFLLVLSFFAKPITESLGTPPTTKAPTDFGDVRLTPALDADTCPVLPLTGKAAIAAAHAAHAAHAHARAMPCPSFGTDPQPTWTDTISPSSPPPIAQAA